MDSESKNIIFLKRHNRKIVEKAFIQSKSNQNYAFPLKQPSFQSESDANDIISLRSRVSQTYNLYQQNIFKRVHRDNQRMIVPIYDLLRQKKNKKTVSPTQKRQNYHILTSLQQNPQEQNSKKKKYLSLSNKKSNSIKNQYYLNSEKNHGIKLIRFHNQQNTVNKKSGQQNRNLFDQIRQFSQRCFSFDCKRQQNSKKDELSFNYFNKIFIKEKLRKQEKYQSSEKTADTTPKILSKDLQKGIENTRQLTRFRQAHQKNVKISPFNFV